MWDRLTAITREKILPMIVDQIGKESVTFGKFLAMAKQEGGTQWHVPVKYQHNTEGGYYVGLELLDVGQQDTRTRAVFEWKQYHKPIVLSNIELAKNGGESGVVSLLEAEMEDAKTGMKDALSTAFFGDGSGGTTMTGLRAAVDDGTNVATYAGIDRTTYTWWQANYNNVGGALTLGAMATMYDLCENGNKVPDMIVTTKAIWSDYEALNQAQIRFINSDGSANKLDPGAQKLAFRATPVYKDEYCPAGKMFFLNTKTFRYGYLKHPKYKTDKNGFALRPLQAPDRQDGQVGFIFHYHQLACIEPRANGQLDNLS